VTTQEPAAGTKRSGSVLRSVPLAALVTGELISTFGSQMTFLALPWFVLQTTGSTARMGIVIAAELAPMAILGIPSGAAIARVGARRAMLAADFGRAPLIASIPVLHAAGALSFPLLLVIVAGVGCFNAPYFAAQRVVLPEIVGENEQAVGLANALIEGGSRLAALLGPSTAGLLIVGIGATNVLYVDAGTYVVSFLLVKLLVPHRPRDAAVEESGGVLAGIRFLVRDRLLGPMIASVIVSNMAGPALSVGLLALAYHDYGKSSRVAGVLVAATSAGAIVGVIAAMKLITRVAPFTLATVAFLGGVLPLWALTVKAPVAVLVLALAIFGAATPLINAPVLGALTMRTPEALRPKVMAAVITVATLASPLGATAAGPLIGAIGTRAVLGLVAGAMTLSALAFAAVVLARQSELTPAPSAEGL
jgi:MFS family permease